MPQSIRANASTASFLRYVQEGDLRSLEALLGSHSDQAYSQARRFLGNSADADDAVQEAFLQLVRTAKRFDGRIPFGSWLGRLVHLACLRALRSRGRHRRRQSPMIVPPQIPDGEGGDDEAVEAIRRAVARLPERYRAPISLHYFGQMDLTATASALGLSVAAVAVRLHRAREVLRARLATIRLGMTSVSLAVALAGAPAHQASPAVSVGVAKLIGSLTSGTALPSTAISLGLIQQGVLIMTAHPILAAVITAGLAMSGILLPFVVSAADSKNEGGASPPSAQAIGIDESFLTSLVEWQSADGGWDDGIGSRITESVHAGPVAVDGHPNVGLCTGLGTLVFLSAGYDYLGTPDYRNRNSYRTAVGKAIGWIRKAQGVDGSFPGSVATNAVLTMTLNEAWAMTGDPDLAGPSTRAVDALLKRRVAPSGHAGWRIWTEADGTISTRTNALCVMALKSALGAQAPNASEGLVQARVWLQEAWTEANPAVIDPESGVSSFASSFDRSGKPLVEAASDPAAALAASCLLGIPKDGPMIRSLVRALEAKPLDPNATHDYADLWLETLGRFHSAAADADKVRWKAWSGRALSALQNGRIGSGPMKGSWKVDDLRKEPASGPVSTSACAVLTLEILLRYTQVENKP